MCFDSKRLAYEDGDLGHYEGSLDPPNLPIIRRPYYANVHISDESRLYLKPYIQGK